MDIEILKALADETRIDILKLLGNREMNVNEIAQNSKVSRPTISHHLQILKRARIVESRKEGKETFYSVNNYVLTSLAQSILGFISY
ncbi:winged helix-turn-helix transcriptional regulator [Clostridium sp. D2Q-14]|nr:winged helix-turn-helix transcriptional regulator [Anaeromonas gelatinilytica]